jgi:hypothetical protein
VSTTETGCHQALIELPPTKLAFHGFLIQLRSPNSLLSTLIPLSGVGKTWFLSNCYKDSAIRYFYDRPPAWRQPSLKLEQLLTTTNAARTNSGARNNKFWSPILRLTFENRVLWPRGHWAPPNSVFLIIWRIIFLFQFWFRLKDKLCFGSVRHRSKNYSAV